MIDKGRPLLFVMICIFMCVWKRYGGGIKLTKKAIIFMWLSRVQSTHPARAVKKINIETRK